MHQLQSKVQMPQEQKQQDLLHKHQGGDGRLEPSHGIFRK